MKKRPHSQGNELWGKRVYGFFSFLGGENMKKYVLEDRLLDRSDKSRRK
jgi:hypothetical protein